MASHFLLYRKVSDPLPVACADTERATDTAPIVLADCPQPLIVVRKLTGSCPICGRSISKLSGVRDPLPLGYDREFQS